jgi:hypothetical protein
MIIRSAYSESLNMTIRVKAGTHQRKADWNSEYAERSGIDRSFVLPIQNPLIKKSLRVLRPGWGVMAGDPWRKGRLDF